MHKGNELFTTLHREDLGKLKEILESNAELVDALDHNGCSALILACKHIPSTCMSLLLAFGADVKINAAREGTALHVACRQARYTFIKQLIDAGADVNAQDGNGYTPLHVLAKARAHPRQIASSARLLLNSGADVSLKTKGKETVEQLAGGKRSVLMQVVKQWEEEQEKGVGKIDFYGVPNDLIHTAAKDLIALGDESGNVHIIDMSGRLLHRLKGDPVMETAHMGEVTKITVSGYDMFTGSEDCNITKWDIRSFHPDITLDTPGVISDWEIAGEFLATCTHESVCRMYSLNDGYECDTEPLQRNCTAVTANEEYVFVGSQDGVFRYFTDGTLDKQILDHDVSALEILDQGTKLSVAVGSGKEEGQIVIFDIYEEKVVGVFRDFHKEKVDHIQVCGDLITTVSSCNAEVGLWKWRSSMLVHKFVLNKHELMNTKWACTNGFLLLSHSASNLLAWDVVTGKQKWNIRFLQREALTAGSFLYY